MARTEDMAARKVRRVASVTGFGTGLVLLGEKVDLASASMARTGP
jgi:hypothetical protein